MAKRILFIEDDPDIYDILQIVFADEGFEVIGFKTAPTLYEMILIHPDLVLLDVRIEGSMKNGSEICKEVKSSSEMSGLPVILLSAERDLEFIAADSGANDYLSKPFGLDHLILKVNQFL
ncbi:response regulator transcription factor [Pedobacter mendelii]|uniref:response regulator transcription factor n=1 Tax=Pedobacter mendelii TaxID=1908240 RepID=UPI003620824A